MQISPSSSQSFSSYLSIISVGQLTTQWESNYHLSTGEEQAALHLLPLSLPLFIAPPFLVLLLVVVKLFL